MIKFFLQAAFAFTMTILLSNCTFFKKNTNGSLTKPTPLSILESFHIPLLEISGLAWRNNPKTQKKELLAIGDREFAIVIIDWSDRKEDLQMKKIDLKSLFTPQPKEQSEWESIYADESGRVFLIKESTSEMIALSPDLKKIDFISKLELSSNAQNDDSNSGLEGLMLLKNGHFLALKEKNPIRLFEFAPKGEKALGHQPSFSIEHTGVFPFNKDKPEFNLVKTLELKSDEERLMEDASGVNTDKEGNLYLLGDQRKLIVSLGKNINAKDKHIKIISAWSIPKKLKQPEGMVIDLEGHPIIAIDNKKKKKPNLFKLSRLK
jgi:uncharacterized protein YjiK